MSSVRGAPCSPSLSDGLFASGGLGNDPHAASRAGADASAAPGAEGAASSVAKPPAEPSTPTSEAAAATAAHAVAAAATATSHAETSAHAQAAATTVAHPARAADHSCRETQCTPTLGSCQLPKVGRPCTIAPAVVGERAGVEVGEILTDAHGSDSFSGKPVGKRGK